MEKLMFLTKYRYDLPKIKPNGGTDEKEF